MVFPRGTKLWDSRYRWAVADSDFLRRSELSQVYLHDVHMIHEGEHSRKKHYDPFYEYEYAYGYSLYAKLWKLYLLRPLFVLDALLAPILLWSARQDSLTNAIRCSAAKFSGIVNA